MKELSPEILAAANVANLQPPTQEDLEIEAKLRSAAKNSTFSMRLAFAEIEFLKRAASTTNQDWKSFFTEQIREKVLERAGHVGEPMISGPSFAVKKITGPSVRS